MTDTIVDPLCTICQDPCDVLVACHTCRKHGWCMECDSHLERCPLCRSGFSTDSNEGLPCNGVSCIVNYRMVVDFEYNVNVEYLIQWTNGERTWEPEQTMNEDIPHLIQAYWFGQSSRK